MRIYTHPEYLNHHVMDGHPERPERLRHLMNHLSQIGLTQDFEVVQPPPIPPERILAAHSQSHVDFLQASQPEDGLVPLDPDTWMSPASLSVAELCWGGFADVDTVLNGLGNMFCAVRPPGIMQSVTAMGFCLLNSVAIAAIAARSQTSSASPYSISTCTTVMAP